MTFRRRIVLLAAAAVAVAIALAVTITYIIVRHDLRASVDDALRNTGTRVTFVRKAGAPTKEDAAKGAQPVPAGAGGASAPAPEDELRLVTGGTQAAGDAAFGGAKGIAQATLISGETILPDAVAQLPVTRAVKDVAAGRRAQFLRDATVAGVHLRILTRRGVGGEALQIARPLTEADATLGRLRWLLAFVMLAGVALAAALGVGVSRFALRPLARLTATAERVTATGDLRHRIPPGGADDEPGRLAAAFNEMLAALEASRDAQRQLVADASHELRTPLTAIRANIELLGHAPQLPADERARMLASARSQLEDLTVLVGDLVDLARPGGRAAEPPEDLRLDQVVGDAVRRARCHAPGVSFTVSSSPCVVKGSRARLARAVGNLLDNAVKWSPPDAPVEVSVRDGVVTVRDHGPGIAPADLPHVFDRFYRAPAARGLPGSGLGLAIVKHVADGHRGTVRAEAAPGGGTVLRLALPAY